MKRLFFLVLLLIVSFSLYCAEITYIYESSISSESFEELPKVNEVFKDEKNNIYLVKAIHENMVSFDKIISRTNSELGDTLTKRNSLKTILLQAGLEHGLLSFSFTVPSITIRPSLSLGFDYRTGFDLLVLAGARSYINLSRLWNNANTFIANGKFASWCEMGVNVTSNIKFATSFGLSYSHNIGAFRWALGSSTLLVYGKEESTNLFLSMGVDI